MIGKRKYQLTLLALLVFALILIIAIISTPEGAESPLSYAMQLGIGIGFLLAPHAWANAKEHEFSKPVKK